MVDAGRTLTPTDQEGDGAPPVMLLRLLTVHVPRLCSARRNLMVAGAYPALVSSLLIHGDQSVSFDVWLSVCPSHTRRAVVNSAFCCATQLPYQFRLRCALLRVHHHRSGLGLIPACNTLPVACVGSCVHVAHSTFYKHLRSFQGTVPGVMWSYPRASDGLQAVTNAAESSMFLHRALACPSTPPLQ